MSVGLVERPLMLGLAAGWATGRWDMALPLAIFLELFWLDVIRLGTIAPPSGAMAFFLLFPILLLLRIDSPVDLPLPLMLCVPCAYAVSRLERYLRERADAHIESVTQWCQGEAHAMSPSGALWRAFLRQTAANAVLFLCCFAVIYGTLRLAMHTTGLPQAPALSWNVLYGVGLMGAVLALRTRRAYAVLALVLVVMLGLHV